MNPDEPDTFRSRIHGPGGHNGWALVPGFDQNCKFEATASLPVRTTNQHEYTRIDPNQDSCAFVVLRQQNAL